MTEVPQSIILGDAVGKQLAPCPFLVRKALAIAKSFPSCWDLCSLDKGHCDFHGKRLKFESFGVDSLRVIFVCPKIVDLSFLKGDVHD